MVQGILFTDSLEQLYRLLCVCVRKSFGKKINVYLEQTINSIFLINQE